MEMTPAEWWSAIGQVVLVIVVSFVVLCAVTSLVRFQLMAERATETEELGLGEEKDFRLNVLNRIAAARKVREPITVMLLRLPPDGAPVEAIEARLKSALRREDVVMRCGPSLIGLLLACGSEKAGIVVNRVATRETLGDLAGIERWRFGVAGYPEHGFKTSELYPRALAMIDEAEATGKRVAGMAPPEAVAEEKEAPSDLVDPLTGLIREEKMIDMMRRYVARERKAERPACLAYLELDQFDRLVETHGGDGVNALLKELAAFLNRNCRENDLLCRFGPGGFVIGMPLTPVVAVPVVQRITEAVRRSAFLIGEAAKITLSAGVAGYPDVQGTAVQYFVAAETALQTARQRGRNQVIKYDPAMAEAPRAEATMDRL
ncbi:MAG TPA: diguanylate cyclase [Kiritimatiellia bacterium]|nr:diguanylate cyclase [Kiritimatiellia bacterium]